MQLLMAKCPYAFDIKPRASTRALLIPELVNLVLEKLDNNSLVSVTRTAKFLHSHASSLLWNDLDQVSLNHLLKLVLGTDDEELCTIEQRWARFDIYASFVRSLTLNFDVLGAPDQGRLRANIQSVALLRATNEPLLPGLRTMHFTAQCPDHFSIAACVLSPSLNRIVGSCGAVDSTNQSSHWDVHIAAFLHKLRHACPQLKELELYGLRESQPVTLPALVDLIRTLSLTTFGGDFFSFQPSVVLALGQTPVLKELTLDDRGGEEDQTCLERTMFNTAIPIKSFCTLVSLDLSSSSAVILPLLLAIRTAQIEDLALKICEKTFSSTVFRTLFSFIPEFGNTLLDLRLEITETVEEDEDYEPSTLEWQTFAPLYKCRRLKGFASSIDSQADLRLEISDIDICRLSYSWPDLTSLSLTWFNKIPREDGGSGLDLASELTLRSFGYLALNCPNLTDLEMSFVSAKAPAPCPAVGMLPSAKLRELHVGRSTIDKPVAVALYLRLLWPEATVYHAHTNGEQEEGEDRDEEEDDGAKWDEVNNMLSVMQCAERVGRNPRVFYGASTLSAAVAEMRGQY